MGQAFTCSPGPRCPEGVRRGSVVGLKSEIEMMAYILMHSLAL